MAELVLGSLLAVTKILQKIVKETVLVAIHIQLKDEAKCKTIWQIHLTRISRKTSL